MDGVMVCPGNALIYNETLPRDHGLRQICGLKVAEGSSLITATFQSHEKTDSYIQDRVPAGCPFYSLRADLSEVQLVYFQKFVDEFVDYIFGGGA